MASRRWKRRIYGMGNATQIAKGGNVPSEWGWGEIRKDFFSILTLRIAARKEKKYYQETDGDKRIMPLSEWCWSRKKAEWSQRMS